MNLPYIKRSLGTYPPPVILDEVQYAPDLFFYIKEKIDADHHKRGQFFSTGSQNFAITEKVTESLAWESGDTPSLESSRVFDEMWKGFPRDGYLKLVVQPEIDEFLWHGDYIQTYLERDGLLQLDGDKGDIASIRDAESHHVHAGQPGAVTPCG